MQQNASAYVYCPENVWEMNNVDKEAAELFRRYSGRLYATAFRITLSRDEAEEIMQETLIRHITKGVESGDDARVWAWLRTTCIRLSVDWLRKRRRFTGIDENLPQEEPDDDGIWDGLDGKLFPLVAELLAELPDGYRAVLTLKLMEGYGYQEIASMLGITEAGVRSQYMRGRKLLAARLKEKLKQEESWTR